MVFKPTGKRVLVKIAEAEQKTAGGIIIPDSKAKENSNQGTIVALGDVGENSQLRLGHVVMFTKSNEITLDGFKHAVVESEDILGILE